MRYSVLLLGLLCASGVSAQSMSYAYRVSGDPQARPVQAFDDGSQMYVQLRDSTNPPIPVGPNGPMLYSIRGPYMVMPITGNITLRFGPFSAYVQRDGAADVAPGVVSVTQPVEVSKQLLQGVQPAPAPAPVVARGVSAPLAASVEGGIEATGPKGKFAIDGATVSESAAPRNGALTFSEAKEKGTYAAYQGKAVLIQADGSSLGATAALAAKKACTEAQARCVVQFRGAPAGKINLVEKQ